MLRRREFTCAVLIDTFGRFLLQQRDNAPGIVHHGRLASSAATANAAKRTCAASPRRSPRRHRKMKFLSTCGILLAVMVIAIVTSPLAYGQAKPSGWLWAVAIVP